MFAFTKVCEEYKTSTFRPSFSCNFISIVVIHHHQRSNEDHGFNQINFDRVIVTVERQTDVLNMIPSLDDKRESERLLFCSEYAEF